LEQQVQFGRVKTSNLWLERGDLGDRGSRSTRGSYTPSSWSQNSKNISLCYKKNFWDGSQI